MTRPRIAIVVDTLGVGGAERLVVQAAVGWHAAGCDVVVVALKRTRRATTLPDELSAAGVEVWYAPATTARELADVHRIGRLATFLRRWRADVVVSHLTFGNLIGGLAARRAGLPHVATLHNTLAPEGWAWRLRQRIEAEVIEWTATAVVAVGPRVADANRRRFRRVELVTVPNPVRSLPVPAAEAVAACRAELLGDRSGPLVVAVGRLSAQKGFGDLVTAAGLAAASCPGLVVAIAGQGDLEPELRTAVGELHDRAAVRLLGARDDVPTVLAAADVFVCSSHWEGLPLTVLEAMAMGVPVVATAVGDVPALLADGRGRLVPPVTPAALATELVQLTADPPARATMADAARAHVARHHAEGPWLDRTLALVERAARWPAPAEQGPRVTIISHGYWPRVGGIERQRAQVTPRLRAEGIRPAVVCRREEGLRRFDLHDGVPVHRTGGPGPKAVSSLRFTLGAAVRVWRTRPDVVQAHELLSTARVGLWARRWLGIPLIVVAHRSGPLGDAQRQARRWSGRRRVRAVVEHADLVIGVSDEIVAELAALGVPDRRLALVRNGVDTVRFAPAPDAERRRVRSELGLGSTEVLAVFLARVAPEKRLGDLLDAWSRLAPAGATLLVAGDGPERAPLEARAVPGVRWLGPVADPAPILNAADVFVLPSGAEGLSNVLLEAAASGAAIVATDVGGARMVVEPDVSGLLVNPGEVDRLAKALDQVLTDPQRRAALGAAARARVEAEFSLDATVAAFARRYRQLTGIGTDEEAPCSGS